MPIVDDTEILRQLASSGNRDAIFLNSFEAETIGDLTFAISGYLRAFDLGSEIAGVRLIPLLHQTGRNEEAVAFQKDFLVARGNLGTVPRLAIPTSENVVEREYQKGEVWLDCLMSEVGPIHSWTLPEGSYSGLYSLIEHRDARVHLMDGSELREIYGERPDSTLIKFPLAMYEFDFGSIHEAEKLISEGVAEGDDSFISFAAKRELYRGNFYLFEELVRTLAGSKSANSSSYQIGLGEHLLDLGYLNQSQTLLSAATGWIDFAKVSLARLEIKRSNFEAAIEHLENVDSARAHAMVLVMFNRIFEKTGKKTLAAEMMRAANTYPLSNLNQHLGGSSFTV